MTTLQIELWTKRLDAAGASSHVVFNCIDKMQKGCIKYGEWDPDGVELRDFYKELEQELLDSINYVLMAIQKNEQEGMYDRSVLDNMLKQIVFVLNYLNTFS